MQRYFLKKSQFEDDYVMIENEDAKHISRVMRMNPEDTVICCDEEGSCYLCELTETAPDLVKAKVVEELNKDAEMPVKVSIAHGLPKSDKLELVIQKGTELGAHSFIPFQADRSIVKVDSKKQAKKLERWEKIAKEAAEQSHRNYVPKVHRVHLLNDLLKTFHHFSSVIVAYEEDAKDDEKSRFRQVLQRTKAGDSLLLVVGPEGGFSDREIEKMKEAGAISCALGPRILRSETAPLYGLAAISYHFELLG
ncbi:16S rRNA (uracil(1498)-N(3))-methyltransferase [Salipaludibacillus sp. CF4.18]|uniref:16S rRNA (uracil(1498)-N(3))-methyltransferase n=1 Tax=Salipaludibacillus sp. CF4.18 TaxID=3373081 RepID=UPI003EE53A99